MKLSELSQKIKKANDSLKEFSDSCNKLSKTMLQSAGIQKKEKNNVRCPKCGSLNVAPIGESKKAFPWVRQLVAEYLLVVSELWLVS